jgi:hypothetical protein
VTTAVEAEFGSFAAATPITSPPRSIAAWLLDGGAQVRVGREAGGVAGWLGASGQPTYVYPEITGYYLQWLAWQALREGGATVVLRRRASSAQHWLRAWVERGEYPQTRVYVGAHQADWRNAAVFTFDVAMVIRGLASAANARLIEPDSTLVERLADTLRRLMGDDGQFDACMSTQALPPPERWSTRRGGFLAKAAAGILCAAKVLPQIAPLQCAAEATLISSLHSAVQDPHAETHPLLYAIEGALSVPHHPAVAPVVDALAAQVEALLQQVTVHGQLPESRFARGIARLDIVAQTLRAVALLRRRAHAWYPDPLVLQRLTQGLARQLTRDGALPIDPDAKIPQYNVWCAMFADQALQVAQHGFDGPILDDLQTCLV